MDEVSIRLCWSGIPKDPVTVPGNFGTEILLLTRGPVTQSLKERFRLRWFTEHWRTFIPSLRLRLSWCADPEVWPKRIMFQLSNPFRLHIVQAVFYRSPDISKIQRFFLKTNKTDRFFSHRINTMFTCMLITAENLIQWEFADVLKIAENACKKALIR